MSSPTSRLPAFVAPGASRPKLPLAVTGTPLLAMTASSAACGSTVATFVTLTEAVGAASPTRRAPKSMLGVFTSGLARLITTTAVSMSPFTANASLPTAKVPRPLLMPATAPALT